MGSRLILSFAVLAMFAGCDRSSPKGDTSPNKPNAVKEADRHSDGDGHDHSGEQHKEGEKGGHAEHSGEIIELGSTKAGDLSVRAARDKGDIKPGGDAPIDVWVMMPDGKPATVAAVRFWIGTQDAKGSIKAKADIEDPQQPNHWHTHVEVPSPLPIDAKLWVEIESTAGPKITGSFGLMN
jgi:hypothetical protein